MQELTAWEVRIADHVNATGAGDAAHDRSHIERVVGNAKRLGVRERASLAVVVPAAWLHDIVSIRKDSPERPKASALAALEATRFLRSIGYPDDLIAPIAHAIEAHSFSAGIAPGTLEAKVVQDADRLDALGAIGIARCFATSGAMDRRLYHAEDPFGVSRPLDDREYALDHFPLKLLRLADTMQTAAGRSEARQRADFLHQFLDQLRTELTSRHHEATP
jgi:uncharacterized protein